MHMCFSRRILRLLPGKRLAAARSGIEGRPSRNILAIILALAVVSQPACFLLPFHKSKAPAQPAPPPATVRLALLPFNVPADNADLRWVSLAGPIIMAKTIENAGEFEVTPLWQGLPVAVESLGATRSITPEVAAYVASRVAAKWATVAELSPGKDGVDLLLDFIPAKSTMVAYRYHKEVRLDALGNNFFEAYNQFLRYLVSPPMSKLESGVGDANAVKALAEALDREYGWYVAADPGKSDKAVADLVRTDIKLARLLFNPTLYPGLGVAPTPTKPVDVKPVIPPPPETPAPEKPPAKPAPPTETAPPPLASEARPQPEPALSPPPPKAPPPRSFSQRIGSALLDSPPPDSGPARSVAPSSGTPAHRQEPRSQRPPPAAPQVQSDVPVPGGSFKVQVFSSKNREIAESVASRLEIAGVKTEIVQVDLKDRGTWFRIRLPGFTSRDSAKEAAEKVVSAGLVQQYWLVP